MIHKQKAPTCGQVRVTFELPSCIWADRIFVTGDFNNWSHSAAPMRQGRDGIWRAYVDLPAGRKFEFRYLVDGKWQTDQHADGWHANEFGSENSVVDTSLLLVDALREVNVSSSLVRDMLPKLAAKAQQPPHSLPARQGVQRRAA